MSDVTLNALIKRINRKLAHRDQQMKITRGERWRRDLGDYYVIDVRLNAIMDTHCQPEALAREIEVLGSRERVVEP